MDVWISMQMSGRLDVRTSGHPDVGVNVNLFFQPPPPPQEKFREVEKRLLGNSAAAFAAAAFVCMTAFETIASEASAAATKAANAAAEVTSKLF